KKIIPRKMSGNATPLQYAHLIWRMAELHHDTDGPLSLWYRHDRQHDIGSVFRVVQDGLVRYDHLCISSEIVTGIGIAVPTREIAAGHVQANAVSGLEDVAGGPQVDFIFVGLAWLDQRGRFPALKMAIAGANDAIGQV